MSRFLHINDDAGGYPESWYAATANATPDRAPLAGDARADVIVIGGGYAGLTAALHLAQAGFDVALLEAHRIGWGASGRNGGQLAAQPRRSVDYYEQLVGRDDAKKIFGLALDANQMVRDLIAAHSIDCDLTDGVLDANHKASFDADSAAYVEHVHAAYGHPHLHYYEPDAVRALVQTDTLSGGIYDGRAGHLHPLNYALGLGAAAEAMGARLYERSEALEIDVDAGRVTTASGALSADWIVFAMNGYHDGRDPGARGRVMPINNFILATEPLPDEGRVAITRPIAVADSRFVINYFRLSPDGRMLFGAGESFRARFPEPLKPYVRTRMLKVFPQLADARIDYAWGGTLGISVKRAPVFRRVGRRGVSVSGWSGSGVHMATLGGAIAAEAVQGAMERFDVLARVPAPLFPGGSALRAPILAAALFWYGLRDRL